MNSIDQLTQLKSIYCSYLNDLSMLTHSLLLDTIRMAMNTRVNKWLLYMIGCIANEMPQNDFYK